MPNENDMSAGNLNVEASELPQFEAVPAAPFDEEAPREYSTADLISIYRTMRHEQKADEFADFVSKIKPKKNDKPKKNSQ